MVDEEKKAISFLGYQELPNSDQLESEKTPLLKSYTARKRKRTLRRFYEDQDNLKDSYRKDEEYLSEKSAAKVADSDATEESGRRREELYAKITFWLNVVLLFAKLTAAVLSHSLSVISTVIDSAVDITSGLVIWLTVRAMKDPDPYEYPRGRNRLEPLAVIIVSIIMGVANIVMIIQSIQLIFENKVHPDVGLVTIVILLTGTAIKAVLLVLCLRIRTPSGRVLAADQRNDIITNLTALVCALIGHYYWVYMDPLGAILVCSYIAGSWFYMASEQIPILSGKTASPEFINRIIQVAISHDDRIKCLDALLVYHYGNDFLVEIHVVLDEDMTLKEAHNVSEPLQDKLERLPFVERAFVHCDYELDGLIHRQ